MKKKIAALTVTAAFAISGLGAVAGLGQGADLAGQSKPNPSWSGGKTIGKVGGMIGFKWGNGR